jgi:Uma2 family endonuclease
MAKARPFGDLPLTVEDFDVWNSEQTDDWEFVGGELVMAGEPSLNHTIIKDNILGALNAALRGGPCRAFGEGVRVKNDDLSARPDVTVSCSPLDHSTPTLAAPVVIVEVTSPTTEGNDSRKWRWYRLIKSLQHFMTVGQEEQEVTLHTRVAPFEWQERVIREGRVELATPGVALELSAIYADTDVPVARSAATPQVGSG